MKEIYGRNNFLFPRWKDKIIGLGIFWFLVIFVFILSYILNEPKYMEGTCITKNYTISQSNYCYKQTEYSLYKNIIFKPSYIKYPNYFVWHISIKILHNTSNAKEDLKKGEEDSYKCFLFLESGQLYDKISYEYKEKIKLLILISFFSALTIIAMIFMDYWENYLSQFDAVTRMKME